MGSAGDDERRLVHFITDLEFEKETHNFMTWVPSKATFPQIMEIVERDQNAGLTHYPPIKALEIEFLVLGGTKRSKILDAGAFSLRKAFPSRGSSPWQLFLRAKWLGPAAPPPEEDYEYEAAVAAAAAARSEEDLIRQTTEDCIACADLHRAYYKDKAEAERRQALLEVIHEVSTDDEWFAELERLKNEIFLSNARVDEVCRDLSHKNEVMMQAARERHDALERQIKMTNDSRAKFQELCEKSTSEVARLEQIEASLVADIEAQLKRMASAEAAALESEAMAVDAERIPDLSIDIQLIDQLEVMVAETLISISEDLNIGFDSVAMAASTLISMS